MTARWMFLLVAMVLVCMSPARADDKPLGTPTNAALVYWRAWDARPEPLMQAMDAEFNGREYSWTPSEDFAAKLEENSAYIAGILEATRIPGCDWGIDYSKGHAISMPHIERLRATARLLVSDCRRLSTAGRMDESVERAAALYRMAAQLPADRIVASSSVALGFARMAADEVIRLAQENKLTPSHRSSLKAVAESLTGQDAFRFSEGFRTEGALTERYLTSTYRGATAGKLYFDEVAKGGEPEDVALAITAMDEAALKVGAAKIREYYEKVAEAWIKPDALDQIKAIERKVLANEFGPLAFVSVSGASPTREGVITHQAVLDRALTLLSADTTRPSPDQPPNVKGSKGG